MPEKYESEARYWALHHHSVIFHGPSRRRSIGPLPSCSTILLSDTNPLYTGTSESCQRVTTRDECETLSEQLGLIRTHSYKGNWTHYPPNCFFIDWGHKQALYFNEYQEGNNLPCTADKICVCKNGLLPSGKIHYKWQRFKDQETPLKIFQNLQDHICASKKIPKKLFLGWNRGTRVSDDNFGKMTI